MEIFDDTEFFSISLDVDDLLVYPHSFLTTMWRWKIQKDPEPTDELYLCRLRKITSHNLHAIECIYKGYPAPNPFLYENRKFYKFFLEDDTEVDLLDYLMIPLDFDFDEDPEPPSDVEDESSTIDDDFVANWPPSEEEWTEDSELDSDSDDEGIWD